MKETNGNALRKEIRKTARISLKKHYWFFVAATLLAAVLGTEYGNATQVLRLQRKNAFDTAAVMEDAANALSGTDVVTVTDVMDAAGIRSVLGVSTMSIGSVYNDIVNGDWKNIADAVGYRMEVLQGKETYIGDVQLGHSRGVFASVINEFESGSLLLSLLTLYDTILGSKKLAVTLFALLGFLVIALFWVFFMATASL